MDTPNDEQIADITKALVDGSKIEAIKIYREATGKSLKESKDFIDALIPKLLKEDPEKYSKLKLWCWKTQPSSIVLASESGMPPKSRQSLTLYIR